MGESFQSEGPTFTREVWQLLEEKGGILEVLGVTPGLKSDGIVWLVYENVNGLPAQLSNNAKLDKITTILDDLNSDIFAFTEHRNNL